MDAIEDLLDFGLGTDFHDLPGNVVERSRFAILDTLAATLAGVRGVDVPELSALAGEWGGAPQATAVSWHQKLPLPAAAFLNGVAARAWDLDDVHEQNTCHINVNIVPLVFALAQARPRVDGRALLAAVSVGAETVCRLSAASRVSFSVTGSSMSYQCGFYGAALTAARLLGLHKTQARHALGIAHARMAGNQQGYLAGASTIRLMQGVAVEGGLLSALMAEKGLTGSSEVLEGRFGYYDIAHQGTYERHDLVEGLGTDIWRLLETSIKPVYPCCKYTHGPIEAAIQAVQAMEGEAIDRVVLKVTNREVHDLVCQTREKKWNPQTLSECQFSLPFVVAHALAHRYVGMESFQPAGMRDPAVRALLPRIEVELDIDRQGTGRGTFPMPGVVTLHGAEGRVLRREVTYVKGHPANPMRFDDVAGKFRECAEFAWPGWNPEPVIDMVGNLEALGDAAAIMQALEAGHPISLRKRHS